MSEVSIRDLRNHGGAVVERVSSGSRITVTRDGQPVAELHPLARPPLDRTTLLERWRHLPHVDPRRLRDDLDETIDPSL